MGKKKTVSTYFDVARFASALQDLITALPSEARKKEINADFSRIVDFLTDARTRFAALPSREDAEQMRAVLARISDFAATAKDNPAIAAALGSRMPSPKKPSVPFTPDEIARAKDMVASIESLPINELRRRLEDSAQFSSRDLQLLAKQMGIRVSSRLSRDALTHHIATRISNFRGYQDLGNVSHPQSADAGVGSGTDTKPEQK